MLHAHINSIIHVHRVHTCTHTYTHVLYMRLFTHSHTVTYLFIIHTLVKPWWQKHREPRPLQDSRGRETHPHPVEGPFSGRRNLAWEDPQGPSAGLRASTHSTTGTKRPCPGEGLAGHSAPSLERRFWAREQGFSAAGGGQGATLGQAHPPLQRQNQALT